jgi:hypothetical protein
VRGRAAIADVFRPVFERTSSFVLHPVDVEVQHAGDVAVVSFLCVPLPFTFAIVAGGSLLVAYVTGESVATLELAEGTATAVHVIPCASRS